MHLLLKKLRVFARRLLGRKGTFLLRNTISTLFVDLGLVEKASSIGKDDCVSAMVLTYNDPDWLEPSILSVKDLVYEYVVVDSSTDETPKILMELRDTYNLNMRIVRLPPGDLVKARNTGLNNVSCRWVLIWDADFIAKPELVTEIKRLIAQLDNKYYYLVYWPMIKICGDLFHVCRDVYHIEHWLYTWSPKLRYEEIDGHDSLIAPLTMYRAIMISKPLGYHIVDVRNPKRIAIKHLVWKKPWLREYLAKGYSIEEVAKLKAREIYGTDDLEEIGRRIMRKEAEKLPVYDKSVFGDYPEILKRYVRKKYGIIL